MRCGLLASFHDRSLEALYRDARVAAVRALRLGGGEAVLDAACGTSAWAAWSFLAAGDEPS